MNSVLLIFIDGLGLGRRDSACNPLARFAPRVLNCFSDRLGPFPRAGICLPTDVQLGVPGLPQSATGQATLFTGANAAALLGKHLSGFPNGALRALIEKESVVLRLKKAGYSVSFANSYTPSFFQKRPRWVSVTTVVCESADLSFNLVEDVRAGRSLFMDYTNRFLRDRGYDVPERSPKQAAAILAHHAATFDFCFYEYFLTDWAGHQGDSEQQLQILTNLDEFLAEIVELLDLSTTSLIVTSDHGNIEETQHAKHTANRVPTILWGPIQRLVEGRTALDLTEIAPLIRASLEPGRSR
jgi:2,3-bisphosphoglycerate-independent phosphoglycerate mutase